MSPRFHKIKYWRRG